MADDGLRSALRAAEAAPNDGAAQTRAVLEFRRAGRQVPYPLALRAADATPSDDEAQVEAVAACRRESKSPPVRILARTPRWRPFADFVARWLRRPLRDGDGASARSIAVAARRLGAMPEALREWFELCGGRPGIHNREGILGSIPLAQLVASDHEERLDEPLVALIDECQGVGFYGLRASSLSSNDPPAVACTEGPLHELGEPLSRFLHHVTIHRGFCGGVSFQAEYGGHGEAVGEGAPALAVIEAHWPRLPFPLIGWGDPPDSGFVLFGDDHVLIEWDTTWHVQVFARDPDSLATVQGRVRGHVAFFD